LTAPSIDCARWGLIFGLLSLDAVQPFVPDMGLQLPEGNEFMAGLRRSVEEVDTVAEPAFVHAVFEWLTLEYGPVFVDHLFRWGESVFQYDPDCDSGAFVWSQIVVNGVEMNDVAVPEFISVVSNNLSRDSGKEIGELVPKTSWDKNLFAKEQYDELTFEWVQSTINHHAFVRAWREAMYESSSEVDWDEIHRWGIHVNERLRWGFTPPEKPTIWELPLPWR
jgi:hypothetical protein